ncbi:hypothetical protein BKA69DRAFT_941605 [Paraphysoderma sedebokerense]|nr:hypothetical protein BKA69DRAFT_941605 [Paraphysoderma sedebokerense]
MSHETQSFPTKLADFFVALELTIPEDTSAESSHNDSRSTLKNSFVYPPTDEGFINNIHLFCFPSSTCFPDQLSTPTFFSSGDSKNQYKDAFFHDFVLTDDNGQHRYVTCLKTTSIHIGDSSRRSSLAPLAFLGGSGYINHSDSSLFGRKSIKCFCLVSRRPLFDTLRKCLAEFYMLSRKEKQRSSNSGSKEVLEDFIWSLLHEVILVLHLYYLPISARIFCSILMI